MEFFSKCAAWTLCFLTAASALTIAQCSTQAFTATKLESALSLFKFKQTGSFGSIEKTFQGCEVWKTVSDVHPDKVKPMCDWLRKKGLQPTNVSAAYHALSASVARNCDYDPELAQSVEDMLLAGGSAADLIPLHHSASGLLLLKEKGWAKESAASSAAFDKAWATIQALATSDGKFRFSSEGEEEGSYLAAGLAVETGAALLQLGLKPPGDEVALLKKAVTKMWAAAVTTQEGVLVPPPQGHSGGAVASTSTAVKGTIALHTALNEPLKVAAKLQRAAEYLLSFGSPSTATEAFHQISALSLFSHNKVLVPLVVRLPTLIYASATLELPVFVSDVLGSVPPVEGVKVVALTGARGKTVAADKQMAAQGPQERGPAGAKFVLNLGAEGVKDAGEYTAKFEVAVDPLYAVSTQLATTFVLVGAVRLTDVMLSVVDGDGSVDQSAASGEQEEGKKPKLSATHLQTLRVEGRVVGRDAEPFVPQQVVLKLVHESGREFVFVTKPAGSVYTFQLPLLKMMEQLFYASGVYKITLTVGDTRMDAAFTWSLGQVDLDLPAAPETAPKPPALKSLSAKSGPASEISHIFRQPEKRPTPLVSYAFTLISLLPLVGFLAGLGLLGVNFDAFPSGGLPLVSATAFHGGIALILLLYFQFWLNMNLFFTLKALVVIGLVTVIPGHFILAHLANSSSKLKTS